MTNNNLIERELKRRDLVKQKRKATVKRVSSSFIQKLEKASGFSQRVERSLRREKKTPFPVFGAPLSSVILAGKGIKPKFPKKKRTFLVVKRRRRKRR